MQQIDQLLTTDTAILDEVPLERLESEIASFASRLAAATARWLIWIAAYDRREGWATWETKSCAHWLNWQCGVSPRTAREHVQIGHKLEEFPALRSVFLAGELSYSKVRAVARVIEPANEADLIDLARRTTASQLERMLGKLPKPDDGDSDNSSNGDDIRFTNNFDGTMTMEVTRPVAEMTKAKKAIEKKASDVIAREQNDGETKTDVIDRFGGMKAIKADTATALITGTVDAPRGIDGVEQATGSEQRIVPRRIRRLLERRDHGMCQHPGCESTNRLHAHHVIHWANGGPTELGNLISLCHFHHHSVHEGGWNIVAGIEGWVFHDPHGNQFTVPVLRLPDNKPLPQTNAKPISGTAAPLSGTGERANLDFIADVLISNTELHKQRLDLESA